MAGNCPPAPDEYLQPAVPGLDQGTARPGEFLRVDRQGGPEEVSSLPTLDEELAWYRQGFKHIAGLDEAGRGCLAGPVVAAAVILPLERDCGALFAGVCDSKQLTPVQRERLYNVILGEATAVGVGIMPVEEITARNIVGATRGAMEAAIAALAVPPDALLLDALLLPAVPLPQRGLIKGDMRCLSIAAASIVAKVARDRMMVELDAQYPGYGFARHKGYATPEHLRALARLGPSPIHRPTFEPVRTLLEGRLELRPCARML
jgi:ribonuclease HII